MPSGVMATAKGGGTEVMVALTNPVAVSITETLLEPYETAPQVLRIRKSI